MRDCARPNFGFFVTIRRFIPVIVVLMWLGMSPISIVEVSAQVTYQTVPPVNTPDPEGFFSVTPPLNPCWT
jgi:hypothetical protein